MNRERAETFLRLLAEAELREPARLALPAPTSSGAPLVMMSVALTRATWALTAVGALDPETAQAILADTDLALAARHRPEPPEAGVISGQARAGRSGRRVRADSAAPRSSPGRAGGRRGREPPRRPRPGTGRTGTSPSGGWSCSTTRRSAPSSGSCRTRTRRPGPA